MESKISKFTGSAEVDSVLERMVQVANEGFTGGRVSKQDLVSWIIGYFEKHCFQECMERIRQDHFDQVVYLESVLKQAKQARKSGAAEPDLAALLAPLGRSGRPERGRGRQLKLEDGQ